TFPFETFKAGSCFTDAVELYVFDKRLRMLAMDALERIEVALRVDISHTLGEKNPFAYLKADCLFPDFSEVLDGRKGVTKHHDWLSG
ncbi:Abi family protein, partial [Pseudoalteromonas sp. G24-MNA-CIBAN-0072]